MAKSEQFGIPTRQQDTLLYAGEGINAVPTVHANRAPTILDRKYPMQTIWRDDVTLDEWMHLDTINGDAIWRKMMGAGGATTTISDTADVVVAPDITGNIQLVEGAGITITSDPVNNLLTVALSGGGGAADSFTTDDGAPAVVPDGAGNVNVLGSPGISVTGQGPGNTITVALVGGGLAVDSIQVDDFLAPGTQPVVPSNAGLVIVTGDQVANGAIAVPAQAIQTKSLALNTYTTQIQQGAAATPAAHTIAHNGICSFDSTQFLVTAGWAQISNQLLSQEAGASMNLGVAYDAGTGVFSITAADGSALSSSNPGFIVASSNLNPGRKLVFRVEKPYGFIDDNGASEIIGNTFGSTGGLSWPNEMPFFIYVITKNDDSDVTFSIARLPHARNAGTLAKAGSALANTQYSMFVMDSTATVADYTGKLCVSIGWIQMTKTAADDWTVTAPSVGAGDGIGRWPTTGYFILPELQNGATRKNLSSSAGGDTIPDYNAHGASYAIDRDGVVHYHWAAGNVAVAGNGAGQLRFHLPFLTPLSSSWQMDSGVYSSIDAGTGKYLTGLAWVYDINPFMNVIVTGTATDLLTLSGIGGRESNMFSIKYKPLI